MEDILTRFEQKIMGMTGPVKKEEIEEFFKDYIDKYSWRLIARMSEGASNENTDDYLYKDDLGISITLNPNNKGFRFLKDVEFLFNLQSHMFSTWDARYEDNESHFENYYMKFRDMVIAWSKLVSDEKKSFLRKLVVEDGDITELEMSIRALNCLKKNGINTVFKLMAISEEELSGLMDMREKTHKEILSFKEELEKLKKSFEIG